MNLNLYFLAYLWAAEFFLPMRLLGSFFHVAMNGMTASDRIFALLDLEEPAEGNLDIASASREFERLERRQKIEETDTGRRLREQSDELMALLQAYKDGVVTENHKE